MSALCAEDGAWDESRIKVEREMKIPLQSGGSLFALFCTFLQYEDFQLMSTHIMNAKEIYIKMAESRTGSLPCRTLWIPFRSIAIWWWGVGAICETNQVSISAFPIFP